MGIFSEIARWIDKNIWTTRRFRHQSREREGSVKLKEWPFILWPKAEEYRILEDPNQYRHKLRLQAFYEERWREVLSYDDGRDDYGQLRPAKWVPVSSMCAWRRDELELLAWKAAGVRMDKKTLDHIKSKLL